MSGSALALPRSGGFTFPASRRLLAGACLAVMVVTGFAIAAAAAAPHSHLVTAGKAGAPPWMAGPLTGTGMHLTAAQFYIVVFVMGAAYLGAILFGRALDLRWVVGAIVLLHVAFLIAPPLLSTDIFSYIDYARLGGVHGLDPYAVKPSAVSHDAIYRYVHWRRTPSAYGPLFTLGSYPLAALGISGALWAFKAIAAVASLGCVALVWKIARMLGRSPTTAVAIFGLNPMLLVWTLGGAHNDLLMLVGLLGAVVLTLAQREQVAGVALAASAAIKASSLVAAPFLILGARRRLRALLSTIAGAVLFIALGVLAFPDHAAGLVRVLRHEQQLVVYDGIPTELAHLAGLARVTPEVRTICALVLIAALAWLVVHVLRGGNWLVASGWAFVAVVVCSPWFLGWYTIWALPFAAVTRDRRLLVATLVIQAYFVGNHLPAVLIS